MSREVFTLVELARAAGVPASEAEALAAAGEVRLLAGAFVTHADAVYAGRLLRARARAAASTRTSAVAPPLFSAAAGERRATALPVAVSGAVHAAGIAAIVLLTSAGLGTTVAARIDPSEYEKLRLVFVAIPGPGGGGGGGGLRQLAPPTRARRKGHSRVNSPLPAVVEVPRPIAPAPDPPEPLVREQPEVVAPVVTRPADEEDRKGVLEETPAPAGSQGSGDGGGSGTGTGTGIGEGQGPGIGPGSGGGTGGGPYRPGSGVEPPRLVNEVRADYTEEGRRRGIQGEVLLEIVVRRDGSVGEVRLLQSLGHGLDQRAIDAVRRWRFDPARRLGTPVDVVVEVAVEFRLR